MKNFIVIGVVAIVAYFVAWPIPIEPVAWKAPMSTGFTGAFSSNTVLQHVSTVDLGEHEGPESVIAHNNGLVYISTLSGSILTLDPSDMTISEFVNTGGRPLGLAFDADDNLIIADAFLGLLSVNPDREITLLTKMAGGVEIAYTNNLDIAADGTIYFTDATTKFAAAAFTGTYPASLLDIMEHGGHGRLLAYYPQTEQTEVLLENLEFANGVALAEDDSYVLFNQTSNYNVSKYWLLGDKQGQVDVIIDNLPGFPDNLDRGQNGVFWLGLASTRNDLLDSISDKPFLRKMVQRLPSFIRPQAVEYGHLVGITGDGDVVYSLQDPEGSYPVITGAFETANKLYIGSLMTQSLAVLDKKYLP